MRPCCTTVLSPADRWMGRSLASRAQGDADPSCGRQSLVSRRSGDSLLTRLQTSGLRWSILSLHREHDSPFCSKPHVAALVMADR
jgi:hypothetical protein